MLSPDFLCATFEVDRFATGTYPKIPFTSAPLLEDFSGTLIFSAQLLCFFLGSVLGVFEQAWTPAVARF